MVLSRKQQKVMGIIVALVGLVTIIAMTDFIFILNSPSRTTPQPTSYPTPTSSQQATSTYEGIE